MQTINKLLYFDMANRADIKALAFLLVDLNEAGVPYSVEKVAGENVITIEISEGY